MGNTALPERTAAKQPACLRAVNVEFHDALVVSCETLIETEFLHVAAEHARFRLPQQMFSGRIHQPQVRSWVKRKEWGIDLVDNSLQKCRGFNCAHFFI